MVIRMQGLTVRNLQAEKPAQLGYYHKVWRPAPVNSLWEMPSQIVLVDEEAERRQALVKSLTGANKLEVLTLSDDCTNLPEDIVYLETETPTESFFALKFLSLMQSIFKNQSGRQTRIFYVYALNSQNYTSGQMTAGFARSVHNENLACEFRIIGLDPLAAQPEKTAALLRQELGVNRRGSMKFATRRENVSKTLSRERQRKQLKWGKNANCPFVGMGPI